MRSFTFTTIILLLVISCGKPKKLNQTIAEIRNIMQQYAPCHEGWFCYEYEFEMDQKQLIISTYRYNYNDEEKFLALTTKYLIPVKEIKSIEKFPTTDDSILIKTKGKDIVLNTEGETSMTDYLALDFNQLFSYDNQLPTLINELREIVNYYREVP